MISYDRILLEMSHQLHVAQKTSNEQEVREAVAAIRSLCEVVLGGQAEKKVQVKPQASVLSQAPIAQVPTSLEAKPLVEEDGANGGSLFDF